jgi:serine protease
MTREARNPLARARRLAVLVVLAFLPAIAFPAVSHSAGPSSSDRLPDLYQEVPTNLRVLSSGPPLDPSYSLGFRSAVHNVGDGPFVVLGHRTQTSPVMTADQLIEQADGSRRTVPRIGTFRYVASPDHSHWHFGGFDRYELRQAGSGRVLVRDRKSGFCLGDRYRAETEAPLAAAAPKPVYTGRCGLIQPGLFEIKEGISVGWGDDYGAFLEFQDLSLDGLPDGKYLLVHQTNAERRIRERSYANDVASVLLELRWHSSKPYLKVLVTCEGSARCDGTRVATSASARPPVAHVAEGYLPDDNADGSPGSWTDLQWNFAGPFGVNAPLAWSNLISDGAPGGAGVTIAVVDTGVAYTDSLPFRISPDFAPGQFVPGWDFVDNDPYPLDENGHGTHVASTIAEATNNSFGLTGLAYGARIMPVRVLDATGAGDAVTIAKGVVFAVDHGAKIVNLSLNFSPRVTAAEIPQLLRAFDYAARHGVLVVAAAGNDFAGVIPYPARSSNVVAVGATTEFGCVAGYSNSGPELDFVAPGGGKDASLPGDPNCRGGRPGRSIYQITFGQRPDLFDIPNDYFGTSMATPHVSATAALLVATRILGPNPTPAQIVARLEGTTRDLGAPGYDEHYGWGLIDAAAATAQPPTVVDTGRAALATASRLSREPASLIVRVHAPVALRSRPRGSVFAQVPAKTELGSPQTLSVVAQAGPWLEVTSERLPSGTVGWINRNSTAIGFARTSLSLRVRLRGRTLELRAGDAVVRRFNMRSVPDASTPTGRFAVTDKLPGTRYGARFGCCVLMLTAGRTLDRPGWLGADRVAIQGDGGTSAGCLCARNADLEQIMATVPLGTPVEIRR